MITVTKFNTLARKESEPTRKENVKSEGRTKDLRRRSKGILSLLNLFRSSRPCKL